MIRVIFISLNNRYRAPSAKAIFTKIVNYQNLGQRFFIESSSILQDKTNTNLDETLLYIAREKGIDLSKHNSNTVQFESLSEFDYIITFDNDDHKVILKLTSPTVHSKISKLTDFSPKHNYKEIKTPKEDKKNIAFVLNLLEHTLQDLISHIKIEKSLQ